jgi:hypothetical protein
MSNQITIKERYTISQCRRGRMKVDANGCHNGCHTWQRWTPLIGQVCDVSKVESRGREFSTVTQLERLFLYVGALAMGVTVGFQWCTPGALELKKRQSLTTAGNNTKTTAPQLRFQTGHPA